MIFTFAQILDIINIMRKNQLVFIAEQLGLNYLSDVDKAILSAAGIDLTKFTNSKGIIEHAFIFGLLSEALGDKRSKGMNYAQFKKFLKSGNFIPLTEDEEFALEQLKNRAYTDLNSLGNRIATGTSNIIIRANQTHQNKLRDIVKNKAMDAVKYRQSAAKLASEIGHATEDWERDWLRISYYLLQDAYNTGRAKSIFKAHGEDAEVWFTVLEGACKHCRELYLKDPDDPDSEPIVFKLKDIIANGNNIGRKADQLLPTISPIHPYCFNTPTTKVITSKGWKNISEVKVGDLALTHKGRFKRVTNVLKHKLTGSESFYNLYYSFPSKKHIKCRKVRYITGNHPVLTKQGWKRVDELRMKDKIYIPALKCGNCGNIQPIGVNNIISDTCNYFRNVESTKRQWLDDNFRRIIHDAVVEEMRLRYENMSDEQKRDITKKARRTINLKYPNGHPWMVNAIKKANKTNGKKRTFIERKLLYFCDKLGVKTITNLCLRNKDGLFRNKVKCYFPDIFIPALGIVLEADGIQWHKDKEYDSNRDKDIKEFFGFDTFRFSEEDIVNNGDVVFEELKNLFNNHSGNFCLVEVPLRIIQKITKNSRCNYLYNLSVEDDESYVADGVIVHNCRCNVNYKDPDTEWDSSTKSFTKVKKYQPKSKKLKGIKLNIKVQKAEDDELNKGKTFRQRLSDAKRETNRTPSKAEIQAGNYKKGHISFGGYQYVIENPRGSYRRGEDKDGKKWSTRMNNTYGYFLGTLGKDKDHIDVFINDSVDLDKFNGKIYVIDQVNKDGTFDEHKVMYGFPNKTEAKKAYLSNYEKGWRGCGAITGASKQVFDTWIRGSKRKVKPFKDCVKNKEL